MTHMEPKAYLVERGVPPRFTIGALELGAACDEILEAARVVRVASAVVQRA